MKNRRKPTGKLEDRVEAIEFAVNEIDAATETNRQTLEDHGEVHSKIIEKLDKLNENTMGVVKAYNNIHGTAVTIMWLAGFITVVTGAWIGISKLS